MFLIDRRWHAIVLETIVVNYVTDMQDESIAVYVLFEL